MAGVGFFVIAEGKATVSVSGVNVAVIGPGDYFGELAMITERARGATVTAETQLRCLRMAFWDLRRFAKENPTCVGSFSNTLPMCSSRIAPDTPKPRSKPASEHNRGRGQLHRG